MMVHSILTLLGNPLRLITSCNGESHHTEPLKWGIPKGKHVRIRCNCSTQEEYVLQARDLKEQFLSWGYPITTLSGAHKKALHTDRSKLLLPQQRINDDKICITGTYDNQAEKIMGILRKHWSLLRLDPDIAQSIPTRPSETYRRGRSIGID